MKFKTLQYTLAGETIPEGTNYYCFLCFSASKHLLEMKGGECHMSRAATFHAEEKILPTLGRLEPRGQAWRGHSYVARTVRSPPACGCPEQRAGFVFQWLVSGGGARRLL